MELSLVFFTVLSQLAVGSLFAVWLVDVQGGKLQATSEHFPKKALYLIGLSLIVGGVASLFHIGHPGKFITAMSHLKSSWLSREALLFSIFFILWILYVVIANMGDQARPNRITVGAISWIVGFLLVFSSGMIYYLPAIPAWNNFAPTLFFFLTALTLGFLLTLTDLSISKSGPLGKTVKGGLYTTLVFLCVGLVSFIFYYSFLKGGPNETRMVAENIAASKLLLIRVVIGWVLPALLVLLAIRSVRPDSLPAGLIAGSLVLALIGELAGRAMFFGTVYGFQDTNRWSSALQSAVGWGN
jgi:anaerobic dimethyl sulfoxide reductase subunit C (anchor subunit)